MTQQKIFFREQIGIEKKEELKTWEKIKENDQLKDIKVIQKGEPIFMRLNVEEEVEYLKDAMKKA